MADHYDQEQATPRYRSLSPVQIHITGGILKERYDKNLENLWLRIDVQALKQVYRELHGFGYAEPEFCGNYIAAGIDLYKNTRNEVVLDRVGQLVETIIGSQRGDGFLAPYEPGMEFDEAFSVWNQQFTILALTAYHELTGHAPALEVAMRCADYIASNFLRPGGPDLMRCFNAGMQHSCILREMARLYRLTGKPLYLEFCEYIVTRWESSCQRLVSAPLEARDRGEFFVFAAIPCWKAIEMLVCYQGIVELYRVTGDRKYLDAATYYWQAVRVVQIGLTGNGSLGETWNYIGNHPALLPNDLAPNENCVAVGFMQLSALLAEFHGEAKYWDAYERTLFNHLLGSQAIDGHDFSYYQGNYGYKVHEKDPGAYSCCRFRGTRALAFLPGHIYAQTGEGILVNLFVSSETRIEVNGVQTTITQTTDFPRNGMVRLTVTPTSPAQFKLYLRMPEWCPGSIISVNGQDVSCASERGYHVINRTWSPGGDSVHYAMEMPIGEIKGCVDYRDSVALTYGPLVLATDSRYGTPMRSTEIAPISANEIAAVPLPDDEWIPMVKFLAKGRVADRDARIVLVDYASAGSQNPGRDEFRVWLPLAAG